MDNEQKPGDQDLPSYKKEQLEKMQAEEERRKKWRIELAANSELQDYFKSFHPKSVKAFIESLLMQKNVWVENNAYYQDLISNEGIEWIEPANKHLKVIQQKKLFDKQCLWRAEKIKIDGLLLCCEFLQWENNIFNCPFIDPVTEEELTDYIFFLQERANANIDLYDGWQDYEKIKAAVEEPESEIFPGWYKYKNSLDDAANSLMTLPDIRGKKEAFYSRICQEEIDAAKKDKQKTEDAFLPIINFSEKSFLKDFVERFETKEMKSLFAAHDWWMKKNENEDLIYSDLRLLFSADEIPAIASHSNWMFAIRQTADKYRLKKIVEALPIAWEHYMLNIQTGIAFAYDGDPFKKYEMIKILNTKRIITGRLLHDEPGDLNF